MTPLALACENVSERMVDAASKPRTRNARTSGMTPLFDAIGRGKSSARPYRSHGANVNHDDEKDHPLMWAIGKASRISRALLDDASRRKAVTNDGFSAHVCFCTGDVGIARLLRRWIARQPNPTRRAAPCAAGRSGFACSCSIRARIRTRSIWSDTVFHAASGNAVTCCRLAARA